LELQGRVPDAQMWVVCKTLIKIMLPIVKKCILNQTHGYWLIFNILQVAFPINVSMQMEIQQSEPTSSNFTRGDFEYQLQTLHLCMMAKVMAILAPFLSFTTNYIRNKAHNMLVLMLDLCFKCLDVVKTFVGRAKIMEMVAKYDIKIFNVIGGGSLSPLKSIIY
jgi:hypothetical protein